MNQHNIKARRALSVLRILETIYLIISFAILVLRNYEADFFQTLLQNWVYVSYFLLPVLLLKNIFVAVFDKGILTADQKKLLLIRCALYVVLSFLAYPLVVAL